MADEFDPLFAPYLSQAKVNNVKTTVLRDSGSSVDVAPFKLIKPDDYTGEFVWLKTPLDNSSRRFPVAKVNIESAEFGNISTKAAVAGSSVKMRYYLLGNSTQNLINEKNKPPKNSEKTRNRTKGITDPTLGDKRGKKGPEKDILSERPHVMCQLKPCIEKNPVMMDSERNSVRAKRKKGRNFRPFCRNGIGENKTNHEVRQDLSSYRSFKPQDPERKFKRGDLVLGLSVLQPNPATWEWKGPGKIESQFSENNYIVKMPGQEKSQLINVIFLKPYHKHEDCLNRIDS